MPILSQDTFSVIKSPYCVSYGDLPITRLFDETRWSETSSACYVQDSRITSHWHSLRASPTAYIYYCSPLPPCGNSTLFNFATIETSNCRKHRRPTSLLIGDCLFLTHAHFFLWGLLFLLSSCLILYILRCDISWVKRYGPIMSTYHHRFLFWIKTTLEVKFIVKQPPRICIVLRTSLDSSGNFPSGCLRDEWHRLIHSRV